MEDYGFSYDGFVSITIDRGILKKIIKQGNSHFSPIDSDIATIHYVGWYHLGEKHGELFDSSRARNKSIRIPLGRAYSIKAFDVVIQTMKCGEICEVIVFPDYAYYDSQIRRYEIELVSFYGYLLTYPPDIDLPISCIDEGSCILPLPGERVTIHLEAYHNDNLFDCRDTTFTMGDFEGCDFPEGIRRALFTFNVGGEYRCQVAKPLSFTPEECERRGIPEDAVLWYRIAVESCEFLQRPSRSASSEDNIAILLEMKSRANAFFEVGKYKLANCMYSSINGLAFEHCDADDYENIRSSMYDCRAVCLIKMNRFDACIQLCDYALQKDPNNERILYRQGVAYMMKRNYSESKKCFEKTLEVNASNKEAERKLKLCNELLFEDSACVKDLFSCAVKQLGDDVFRDSAE